MTGIVFNIQRFSLHDGPGIRTTVFLKGCSLHCFWCHNPEGIALKPEIQFFPERCILCGACVDTCEHGANSIQDQTLLFSRDLCAACGKCVDTCYAEARLRVGRDMTAAAVLQEILTDRPYYATSGGGVTLSGGEPALQPEFAQEILAGCKAQGIHTAIETAGNVPWANLACLLPVTDLILMDLKHMDPLKHRAAVGVSNVRLLQNARRLVAQTNLPILFRIPVIPGVNDSLADVSAIADFVRQMVEVRATRAQPGTIALDLLPFHRLAGDKYRSLDSDYRAKDLVPPNKEKMLELAAQARAFAIEVGGR
jgi:pyruvate formate lyase activating enzyme